MRSICLTIVFASMASSLRCPSLWTLNQSNCYRYFPQQKSFWSASNFCRKQLFCSIGLHSNKTSHSEAVSIHSQSENELVNSILPSDVDVFLGLYHNITTEGNRTWHWTDGSPFDYNNWAPGQPDLTPVQDYGVLWNTHFPSQWDDSSHWNYSFVCKMPADDCLTSLDEPVDDDCKNGGNYTGGICVCSSPYSCIDCSWYNGCSSNPCQNGGKCTNQEQSYFCECDDGFTGNHCEMYKGCSSNPCQNGGKCINKEQSYSCECDDDFNGTHCEMYKGSSKEVGIPIAAFGGAVGTLACFVVGLILVIITIVWYSKRRQKEKENKPTENAATDPRNDNNYKIQKGDDNYMETIFVPEKMYTSLQTIDKH